MKAKSVVQGVMIVMGIVFGANAWAATIYIDAASTCVPQTGAIDCPFNTIQPGINAAVAGDTVSVAPGIYHGAIELKNQVKLVSQMGPEVTEIDGMGASPAVRQPYSSSANTYIEGFKIYGSGVAIMVQNRASGWAYNSMEIHRCIIKDVNTAIYPFLNSQVILTRTLIYFVGTGLDVYGGYYGGTWTRPQIKNVTMDLVSRGVLMYMTGADVYNLNITRSGSAFSTWGWRGWGDVRGCNNNFWNVALTAPGSAGQVPSVNLCNTMNADPRYVMSLPHGVDYRLQEGSPLIDAGIDVGLPYQGAAPDIGAYETDYVQSIPELTQALAESYQEVPLEAFKNAGEQRLNAFNNKFTAVLQKLNTITDTTTDEGKMIIFTDCLNKLEHDIWAKADGFYGGNPDNDWIVTREEQDRIYPVVMELINAIRDELGRLTPTPAP